MFRCRLILILLACLLKGSAQNLLANGNFEDRNICLEFHSGCAPEAWFRVPLFPVSASTGTAGFYRGNRFESLVIENLQHPLVNRSFIYTKLLCRLDSGFIYQFNCAIRAGEEGFEHLNVLLLPFEPNRNKQYLYKAKQQLTITRLQKIKEYNAEWFGYQINFTATGKEKYLVIGNFSADSLKLKRERNDDPNVIYDIDNISLYPIDSTKLACPEWKANTVILYQNNSRHTINNFLDEEEPVNIPLTAIQPTNTVKIVVPPIINDTLIIPDVLFKLNSSELNPRFSIQLDSLVKKIQHSHFTSMEIIGHTDSLGTKAHNLNLSYNRAVTVKNYMLQKMGTAAKPIQTKGMADEIPVASNRSPEGRQKNRRVEIVLIK
jgi:outer membrane protein OmpA-like peptidoglycan-associated protein